MAFDPKNWKFSSDVLKLSADEFKAMLKSRYGLKVAEINILYKQLHGDNLTNEKEGSIPSE